MRISELETPAIVIDLDIMERNLQRVAGYAKENGLRLRPHTKTHKIPALARKQMDLGAVGVTVAKVGEAEVMLEASPPDLYVAYPVVGRKKHERLMEVAARTRLTVGLDNLQSARQLSDAAREARVRVSVLAEVDVGLGRVGVNPGEELNELGRQLTRLPHLDLLGITFYPGHIKSTGEEADEQVQQLSAAVRDMDASWKRAGLPLEVVSGGSTPALFQSHLIAGLTEIRPGTYIFNDKNTWFTGACRQEDCAASILTTVVSTSRPRQMIIDGGSKTFSSDRLVGSSEVSFGYVMEAPTAVFSKMNEEHGFVDLRSVDGEFSVGDKVRVIPNHICVAMNLHEQVYGIRGDEVVETWRVAARGKLQ
ncbi:MAG: alanine racemase [Candidatus Solibacter usitatus]|nr:alanine racemase [Candidatus Solibacter usitatus]